MSTRQAVNLLAAVFFLGSLLCTASRHASAQHPSTPEKLPEFEAASVKPCGPDSCKIAGFYGQSGGRVLLNGSVTTMVQYAFRVEAFQVAGGPAWARTEWFSIEAVPPDSSPARAIRTSGFLANMTQEQSAMLQSLLETRFALKWHRDTTQGPVYILTRGKGKLEMQEPKDKHADPRAIIAIKQGGIVDGSAFGTNTTMGYLATRLGQYLNRPVLDRTGIQGAYDFELPVSDPTSQDLASGVFDAVQRLGLKLQSGKGPVETIVIDSVEHPSEN